MRLRLMTLLASLALAGCVAPPAPAQPAPAFNETDVMFLQMGLEQIAEGDQVAVLAEQRAADPRIRAIATELRGQWHTESATMRGWLDGWHQPSTPDPDASAHAGHGELHMLRPSDIAELRSAEKQTFDRTALSLLIGHLHNCVETTRMESGGGRYPAAINLATEMTRHRQSQIQRMLVLSAQPTP